MALARWNGVVQDAAGNAVSGASIEVRDETTGFLVPLFSDRDGTIGLGNPYVADGPEIAFHARGGNYRVKATKGTEQKTWRWVAMGTAQALDADQIATYLQAGIVPVQTRAELDDYAPAIPAPGEPETPLGGVVYADPDTGLNGYYTYNFTTSEWDFARPLSDTLAGLSVVSVDDNEISAAASPGVNPAGVKAFYLDLDDWENTGPVTIRIDGAAAIPVVDVSGGEFLPGFATGRLFLSNEGSSLRMIVGGDYMAAVALAIDAAIRAEEAAAGLNLPTIQPGDERKQLYVKSDLSGYELDKPARGGGELFKAVSDMLADDNEVIGYEGSGADVEVAAGAIIVAQGFRFPIAASDATDQYLTNAGSVKLYAAPDTQKGISTAQFGIPDASEGSNVQAGFEALVRACREQGATLVQPPGSDIHLIDAVEMRLVRMNMMGRVFRNHATEPALIVGGDSRTDTYGRNNPPQHFWEVVTMGGFDYPAIIVKGLRGSHMKVQRSNSILLYADTTLALSGSDTSIAYNTFDFFDVGQIEIANNPATDGDAIQWINENKFNLKRTSRIYIGRNSTYKHNHNVFDTPNIEGESAAIIIIDHGQDNQFRDLRFEGSPVITLTENSRSNVLEYSWNDNSDLLRDPDRLWRNGNIDDKGTGNRVIYAPRKKDVRSVLFSFNARRHKTFSIGTTVYSGGCEHKLISAYPVGFSTVARGSGATILDWTELVPFPKGSRLTIGCDAATIRPNVRFYDANRKLITSEPATLVSSAVQWNTDHIRTTSTNQSGWGVESRDANVAFISVRVQGGSAVLPFSALYAHIWNHSPDTLDIFDRASLDRIGPATRADASVPSRGVPVLGQVVRSPDGTSSRCSYQWTTQTTADVSSGASTVDVPSGHGATIGNRAAIELGDGTVLWSTVSGTTATSLTFADALPSASPNGSRVEIWAWAS